MRSLVLIIILFAVFFAGPEPQTALAHKLGDAENKSIYPFLFHSGFWINLHHFLYEQAAERNKPGSSGSVAGAEKGRFSMRCPFLFELLFDPYRVGVVGYDSKPWALPTAIKSHTFGVKDFGVKQFGVKHS